MPRQYHTVVNITACFAIAINFLLPGELVMLTGWPMCENCSLYNLHYTASEKISYPLGTNGLNVNMHDSYSTLQPSRFRTSITTTLPAPTQRKTLPATQKRRPELLAMVKSKRPKQTTSLAHMTASLVNVNSARRFITHISMWRVDGVPTKKEYFKVPGSWDERAARYYLLG